MSHPERTYMLGLAIKGLEKSIDRVDRNNKAALKRRDKQVKGLVLARLKNIQELDPEIIPFRLLAHRTYQGHDSWHCWRDVDYLPGEDRFEDVLRIGTSPDQIDQEINYGTYQVKDSDWATFGPQILVSLLRALKKP